MPGNNTWRRTTRRRSPPPPTESARACRNPSGGLPSHEPPRLGQGPLTLSVRLAGKQVSLFLSVLGGNDIKSVLSPATRAHSQLSARRTHLPRSEERRVGKDGRWGWAVVHSNSRN